MTTSTIASKPDALFIYYKIDAALHSQTVRQLATMTAAFNRLYPNITLEVMQRPEVSAENQETWMEVYRGQDLLAKSCIDAIQDNAIRHGLPAARRVELFVSPLV